VTAVAGHPRQVLVEPKPDGHGRLMGLDLALDAGLAGEGEEGRAGQDDDGLLLGVETQGRAS
jgi:hypothetical protein